VLARVDPGEYVLPALVGLGAVMVGLLAGESPKFAVAASLAVAFMLVAMVSLSAGVVVFALITYLELAPAIGGPALSFTKVAGGVLALSFIAAYSWKTDKSDVVWAKFPLLSTVLAALIAWHLASYFWAEQPGDTATSIIRMVLNSALLVIVYEAVRDTKTVRAVVGAMVAGAAVAAVYGIIATPSASEFANSATAGSGLGRIAGTVGDPNELASLLVVGLVLSGALAATCTGGQRAIWMGAAVLCGGAMFLTGSRGGLVALAAVFIAAILMAPRRRALVIAVALIVTASAAFYYTSIASEDARERITLSDGGTGRTDIWRIGWRMFEDKPVHGVGVNNFQSASIHYLLAEPGAIENDTYVVDQPAVAHNSYLHLLAELGLIGLSLFLLFLALSLGYLIKAVSLFKRAGNRDLEILATALALSVVGLLAADFFLSEQYSKQLWILLALAPALYGMARREEARARPSAPATKTF
jgi:exopolysaccharide production protein ExoQ